jgi:putative transposase
MSNGGGSKGTCPAGPEPRVEAASTTDCLSTLSYGWLVTQAAITVFTDKYAARYPKAIDCLTKDREALLTFFDFPAHHWDHLRTSNPIESVFAAVRHRTVRTKGALSYKTARLMVFKLVMSAAKTWRRLKGENQLPMVVAGVKFSDGVAVSATANHRAAWIARVTQFQT